jgi:hypothetical protein
MLAKTTENAMPPAEHRDTVNARQSGEVGMRQLLGAALLAVVLAVSASSVAMAAPECKTGKPCGDSCISKDKTCNIKAPAKECKTGKLCGDTCISKDKTCTK